MSANPNPIATASFRSDVFNYDPLYASETISRSAQITGFAANSVAKRGTVLFGAAPGLPDTSYSNSGSQARAILAVDVTMPPTGPGNALVYIQGKFLESGMTFSAAGAAADAAMLWQFGVYVLDVMDRTGLMVPLPLDRFVQEEGPARMDDESRKKAIAEEIAKIRAAGPQPPPTGPDGEPRKDGNGELRRDVPQWREPNQQPAWAQAAFENAVREPEVPARPAQLPADPRHPGLRPPVSQHPADPPHVGPGHEGENKPGHEPSPKREPKAEHHDKK